MRAAAGQGRNRDKHNITEASRSAVAMTLQGALDAERTAKVGVARGEFGAVPTRDAIFFIVAFTDRRGAGDFRRRLERSAGTLRHASFHLA